MSRSGCRRRFRHFNQNTAHFEEAVHPRVPKLLFPGDSGFVAGALELLPIVGSAFPGSADDGTGKSVLGCEYQRAAARFQDATDFEEPRARIWQVLDDPATGDTVEGIVGERQLHHIAGNEVRSITLQPMLRPAKHLG